MVPGLVLSLVAPMDSDVTSGVEAEIIDGLVDAVNDDVSRTTVEIESVVSCFVSSSVVVVVVVVSSDVGWSVVKDSVVVAFVVDE